MIVSVTAEGAALADPRDCTRFHIEVDDEVAMDAVLQSCGAGSATGDGERANIEIAWLRRSAAGSVDDSWNSQFEAMIAFAASSGWLVNSGSAIQGHVERTDHRQR
jgi:hypothetical protein